MLCCSVMGLNLTHVTPVLLMIKNMSRFILKKNRADLCSVSKYCETGETLTRETFCIHDDKSFSNKCYNCITYKTKLK